MTGPATQLDAHEKESFQHNGFLSLKQIITADELATLRDIYDRLLVQRSGWDDGQQFDLAGNDTDEKPKLPQILEPSKYAPELADTMYLANASKIAKQLFGDDLLDGYGEHMIYKPAEYGSVTPWHQDQAYGADTKRKRGVNFWLPLDDATVESGCLHFVPGSHRRDLLPHHPIGHDPKVHGLEVDDPEKCADYAAACPIPAGGATMHAAYMLHYAGQNTTSSPRRAYILHFKATPVENEHTIEPYWLSQRQTARLARAATPNPNAGSGMM